MVRPVKGSEEAKLAMKKAREAKGKPKAEGYVKPPTKKQEEKGKVIEIPVLGEDTLFLPSWYAVKGAKNKWKLFNPTTQERNLATRQGQTPFNIIRKPISEGVYLQNANGNIEVPFGQFSVKDREIIGKHLADVSQYKDMNVKDVPSEVSQKNKPRGRPEYMVRNIKWHQKNGISQLGQWYDNEMSKILEKFKNLKAQIKQKEQSKEQSKENIKMSFDKEITPSPVFKPSPYSKPLFASKPEPKTEPKSEPKPEPKPEPKLEPKPEPKSDPKSEPPKINKGKPRMRFPFLDVIGVKFLNLQPGSTPLEKLQYYTAELLRNIKKEIVDDYLEKLNPLSDADKKSINDWTIKNAKKIEYVTYITKVLFPKFKNNNKTANKFHLLLSAIDYAYTDPIIKNILKNRYEELERPFPSNFHIGEIFTSNIPGLEKDLIKYDTDFKDLFNDYATRLGKFKNDVIGYGFYF
jgi:hypothetical protein